MTEAEEDKVVETINNPDGSTTTKYESGNTMTKYSDGHEEGILHFGIGKTFGQLLTNISREIAWYECKRDTAILKLMNSLGGMTNDQAESIIDGKMKLVTKNRGTVEMVEDNWTPPYDPERLREEILEATNPFVGYPSEHPRGGSWFSYLPDDERDIITNEAKSIRLKMKSNIFEAHKELDGFKELWMHYMTLNSKRMTEKMSNATKRRAMMFESGNPLDQLRQDAYSSIATNPNLDEETKRRLLTIAKGQMDAREHGVEVEPDPSMKLDTGWLHPDGTYYGCQPGQHIPLSHELVDKFYPQNVGDREQILENEGWVKCTDSHWYKRYQTKLTSAQFKAIELWAKVHGEPFEFNCDKMTIRELKEGQ